MKRKKKVKHENNERWLLTYSDLITLLMIFFLIMYSMSSVDKAKYDKVVQSMSTAMGGESFFADITESGGNGLMDGKEFAEFETLKDRIDSIIAENNIAEDIVVKEYEKGLVISFKDGILFDSGSDVLKDNAYEKLTYIGKILKESESYARVEGHTDNRPIHNNLFNSNWALSSSRATKVLEFFIEKGYISPEKICAVGYGEYRPIDTNDTDSGRKNNRRVDIVLLNSKFEEMER